LIGTTLSASVPVTYAAQALKIGRGRSKSKNRWYAFTTALPTVFAGHIDPD
jgi:hypothetical protein